MEEESQRALVKHLQKEQERERRRIRDRQRRQSMTLEEREKHLARRRRNYQLRRQRAENARSDPSCTTLVPTVSTKTDEFPISVSNVDFSVQCNGLDIPAYKLAQLPSRVRLNHVKHLARSLNLHVNVPTTQRISVDLIIKGNEIADSSCVPLKGLRLNRVKRLARSLSSGLEKVKEEDHQSRMEEFVISSSTEQSCSTLQC
ncbi:uncharacterized protein [Euphorbia lathyris]|uniref:uncharacterized protein isoform X2 n=1 Tax=Euphorbia lathyris TaxID=212925 RepID=UPI003313EC2C